ncbi:peptidoglycan DD-metalloendopeptidase family protein [Deinococcus apachensis]|uniref:peptidoglycan DD-metalloendopeptidase family protein n=1 Tax=Deinococcus apachensis TaxID=309886 RepID=UPI000365365D|nr:peptidoglycan DD-metalloendopeptidase family protein [Deinococcus apachensis]
MPEFPSRPTRGHAPLPRRLALTLALSALAPLAAARPGSPEGVADLLGVPTPADLLQAALPSVHLTRVAEPPSVLVVSTQPPASVAARYGVPPAAVAALPRHDGEEARLLRVRLPAPVPDHPPALPASIVTHTVRPGETLASIAADAGLDLVDLLSANLDRTSLDDLEVGEVLYLPTAERGLLVRIKPGQTALTLIAGYGADLARTARANDVLPTALGVGDYLLLPGVRAQGLYAQLARHREAREEAERRAEMQARYDRYLAQQKERERARLQELYVMQAKYEAYLAWRDSPERQRLIEAYEQQAQYEAAQAALREREQAAQPLHVQAAGVNVAAAGHLAWPVQNSRITSRFGEADIDYHKQIFHGGVDLAAPAGTPVYAAADGTVTESGYGAYGMNVYTAQGDSTLVYGHLSRTAVTPGQAVRRGDLLGEVGCTGICTGPHLHFEVRLDGRAVDPLALLP